MNYFIRIKSEYKINKNYFMDFFNLERYRFYANIYLKIFHLLIYLI